MAEQANWVICLRVVASHTSIRPSPPAADHPTVRQHRHRGVVTQRDCLSWRPGSGLLLSGLAREEVASVRFELAGRAPVRVATFGRNQPVPWVAFVSPPLPAGAKLERVVALDAAGRTVGTQERFGWPWSEGWSPPTCRPRAG
jgi:hypothetical protein